LKQKEILLDNFALSFLIKGIFCSKAAREAAKRVFRGFPMFRRNAVAISAKKIQEFEFFLSFLVFLNDGKRQKNREPDKKSVGVE
jgi:hypothetical protein